MTLTGISRPALNRLDQHQRVAGWQRFVRLHRHDSWRDKLTQVNRYVNQFEYQRDATSYRQGEYWATPYEFILRNGGDCEDFAIAKYFLLRSLGIQEHRLQITYTHHQGLNQYHMVLVYHPAQSGRSLVLDNLSNSIRYLRERPDIEPIYGFNSHQLWVLDKHARQISAGTARRLTRWQALLGRMRSQPIRLDMQVKS